MSTNESSNTKNSGSEKPHHVGRLRAGDEVRNGHGELLFRVDPAKKAANDRQRELTVRRASAMRSLPAPHQSSRTNSAVGKLTKKHQTKKTKSLSVAKDPLPRNVVGADFGLGSRRQRVAKRSKLLKRKVHRRRRARRARGAAQHHSKMEDDWDRELASQTGAAYTDWTPKVENGESWWGGLLDTAIALAPHVIPMVGGVGDYEETDIANQTVPRTNSLAAAFSDGEKCGEVPEIHCVGATTRFTHREYLGDVYSTTASFSAIEFPVNPGMNEVFPWGSRSMINYEQFQLMGSMFVFESEASENTASPGLGYVALSSQYDVTEPSFSSKKEMLQSQFAVARKPSEGFAHWIECNPDILVLPKKFIRGGKLPAGSDRHLYDHCKTILAVGGQAMSNVVIGELWHTYDTLVMFPRTDESLGAIGLFLRKTSGAPVTTALPFGLTWNNDPRNTFDVEIGGGTITFPANFPSCDMLATLRWTGTATVGSTLAIPLNVGQTNMIIQYIRPIGTGGPFTGVTAPASFEIESLFQIAPTTIGPIVVAYSTSTLLTNPNSFFELTLTQVPRQTANSSSSIFDWGGREAEARYRRMREALDPTLADICERETRTFSLVRNVGDWHLISIATGARRSVEENVAKSLSSAPDGLFDVMALALFDPSATDIGVRG